MIQTLQLMQSLEFDHKCKLKVSVYTVNMVRETMLRLVAVL
ncbi:hypothetical protein IFVP182_C290667 [Vibrio parahaemolyticus]